MAKENRGGLQRLTFDQSGRHRHDARPGPAELYRVPPDRVWWTAVGAPLEGGVRRHSSSAMRRLARGDTRRAVKGDRLVGGSRHSFTGICCVTPQTGRWQRSRTARVFPHQYGRIHHDDDCTYQRRVRETCERVSQMRRTRDRDSEGAPRTGAVVGYRTHGVVDRAGCDWPSLRTATLYGATWSIGSLATGCPAEVCLATSVTIEAPRRLS